MSASVTSNAHLISELPGLTQLLYDTTKDARSFNLGFAQVDLEAYATLHNTAREFATAEQLYNRALENKVSDRVKGTLWTALCVALVAGVILVFCYVPLKTKLSIVEEVLKAPNGLWALVGIGPVMVIAPFVPIVRGFYRVPSSLNALKKIDARIPDEHANAARFVREQHADLHALAEAMNANPYYQDSGVRLQQIIGFFDEEHC